MEIVKKNMLSIICGVVALVALLALVWPVSGMYATFQTDVLKKREIADNEVKNLVTAPRFWPVIPDLQSGEKAKLDRFPSDPVILEGIKIKDNVTRQAKTMRDETARNNEHQLLVPDSLPNPKDLSFRFQQTYLEMVQDKVGTDGVRIPSRLKTELLGTTPPTDQDVLNAAAKLWTAQFQPKILVVGGKEVNFQQEAVEWQKECTGLQAKLRLATAQRAKMYLEPDWISIQKNMLEVSKSPSQNDLWFAQNMLWVQTDLIESIKKLNAGANDVTNATVKHIYRIEVADDQNIYVQNANTGGAQPAPTDAPGKVYSVSSTGRVCNPLYDVVKFQIVMSVEAAKIPIVLAELQRGKLITVQQVDESAVDGIAAADAGYVYGDVAVAKLTIQGEELFLRDWRVKYMPPQILTMLQVAPPANTPR